MNKFFVDPYYGLRKVAKGNWFYDMYNARFKKPTASNQGTAPARTRLNKAKADYDTQTHKRDVRDEFLDAQDVANKATGPTQQQLAKGAPIKKQRRWWDKALDTVQAGYNKATDAAGKLMDTAVDYYYNGNSKPGVVNYGMAPERARLNKAKADYDSKRHLRSVRDEFLAAQVAANKATGPTQKDLANGVPTKKNDRRTGIDNAIDFLYNTYGHGLSKARQAVHNYRHKVQNGQSFFNPGYPVSDVGMPGVVNWGADPFVDMLNQAKATTPTSLSNRQFIHSAPLVADDYLHSPSFVRNLHNVPWNLKALINNLQ
jgi:hypothetical protein